MRMPSLTSARNLFSSSLLFTFSPPKHFLNPSLSSVNPRSRSSIKMSSSTIEHIVLFQVKQNTESTKINTMLTSLNGLVSLDPVLHLAAAPIHRVKSAPIPFTHVLHSRYSSKENLNTYTAHPNHTTAVKENVLPICDDIMAVDWIATDLDEQQLVPPPGSAVRVTILKLKENLGENVKSEILEVIKGIKGEFGGRVKQLTCGENFSPGRAKGFSIASLAVFEGLSELDAVDAKEEILNLHKERVRDYLESVIVVDYVVPSLQSAI